ncbi:MAG: hypothetical protein WHX52_23115 [Anaerolineae bacterium]
MKKIKYILLAFVTMLLLLAIVVACNIAITPESQRSDYLFCRQMSEYTAAFDALNQAVYEQLPVYPDAQLITITIAGGDDYFWTPSSRQLMAYYISNTPFEQVQEFFERKMPAQGWLLTRKDGFEEHNIFLDYQNQSTCISIVIKTLDRNEVGFISRHILTGEIPMSTQSVYTFRIFHAQEAVPGAPTPHPEGSSLIRCFIDDP